MSRLVLIYLRTNLYFDVTKICRLYLNSLLL